MVTSECFSREALDSSVCLRVRSYKLASLPISFNPIEFVTYSCTRVRTYLEQMLYSPRQQTQRRTNIATFYHRSSKLVGFKEPTQYNTLSSDVKRR